MAVGSRGLGFIERAQLSSVSTNVLRVAAGLVLICPRAIERNAGRSAAEAAATAER